MKSARDLLSELLGTFALTFFGGAAIMQTRNADVGAGLLEVALAHGLVLGLMVTAFMRIGGNFNPAVSLGLLATGRIKPAQAASFIAGQFTGAAAAALSLKMLFPAALFEAARGTRQMVSLDVTTTQARPPQTVPRSSVIVCRLSIRWVSPPMNCPTSSTKKMMRWCLPF